ncbi:Valine--tRNA ligase, partial [Zostera marina]
MALLCNRSVMFSRSSNLSFFSFYFSVQPWGKISIRRRIRSTHSYSYSSVPRRTLSVMAGKEDVFNSPASSKSFDFTDEEKIYKWWESQEFFKPNFDSGGGDPFVISMPPPNVTGSLHMGHAMFVTLEDIMVRYSRMKGRPTLWLPGTDHAGIATQLVVEKLLASEGVKRTDLSRDEFTSRVWEWKEKYGSEITNQIKRLGASCDWSKERFTLDDQLS